MNAIPGEQPATPAGAPPVPVTLRAIAAWLESHPEVESYSIETYQLAYGGSARVHVYGLDAKGMARLTQAVGGHWEKEHGDLFKLRQQITPHAVVELCGSRERVCKRVVTGTTLIEEPDPEALAAVPKVTREIETYEWRCDPILAGRDSA